MSDVDTVAPAAWQMPLDRLDGHHQGVALPEQLAHICACKTGDTITITAGCNSMRVPVKVQTSTADESDRVAVSPKILTGLGLTPKELVHVLPSQGKIRIGPVVGILAPRRSGLAKPYQAQTALFKRIITAAREMGIVAYVFDFHQIRWGAKRVHGYTFAGGAWVGRMYPLPDVVFDRATGTFPGGSSAADISRRRLTREFGIKIFNTRLGNKLRMHKLMHADSLLRAHLPPTYRVTGSGVVAGILAHHRGAYLKPQNGAMGKGIIRLRRSPKGVHYTLTTDSYQRVQGTAASAAGALARLRSHVGLSGYLAQPELSLIRVNGRICDVRALVQRGAEGAWHVTGIGIRAGKPGSVVSNLHGGGKALRIESVLRTALGAKEAEVTRIKEEIEQLAIRVGEVLARATRCLGELGVDLGVDTQGRVWIIEANSRTGRATFRRAGMPDAAKMADRNPLLFAMHLAGFSS